MITETFYRGNQKQKIGLINYFKVSNLPTDDSTIHAYQIHLKFGRCGVILKYARITQVPLVLKELNPVAYPLKHGRILTCVSFVKSRG